MLKLLSPLKSVLFFTIFSLSITLNAQEHNHSHGPGEYCGVKNVEESLQQDKKDAQAIRALMDQYLNKEFVALSGDDDILYLPITVHIVREDDGTGGIDYSDIQESIDVSNDLFAAGNIQFFVCGDTQYIDDSSVYDFSSDVDADEDNMLAASYVDNTINIYFVGNANVCGYAYLPPGPDVVLMNNSCTGGTATTLAHELGHFTGLYHTHQRTSNGPTSFNAENVDRTGPNANCTTGGDLLCDTEADPQLGTGTVNTACVYTGTDADQFGVAYTPDPKNVMSYARKSCRTVFTPEQLARCRARTTLHRSNLTCPTPFIGIEVIGDKETCLNTLTVELNGQSTEATGWKWDINGDGTFDYFTQNVTHTYNTPGQYDVTLEINTGTETHTITETALIKVGADYNMPYIDDFSSVIVDNNATGFTNGWSTIPANVTTGFRWNTNNGSTPSTSTGPNGDNSPSTDDKYLFTEASGGSLGDEALLISPCINIDKIFPTLSFAYHMYGDAIGSLHVDIIKQDGTIDYDIAAPLTGEDQTSETDNYKIQEIYLSQYQNQSIKIQFRAIRGDDFDGDIAIDDINIKSNTEPLFDFESNSELLGCGTTIDFTGISGDASAWDWDVNGDGITDYTTQNPSHTYPTAGDYDVTLKITVDGLVYTKTKTDFVTIEINPTLSLPFIEDFESYTNTTDGSGWNNGWSNTPENTTLSYRWDVNNGTTPSSLTGPNVDNTVKTTAGKYIYTEASSGSNNDEAILTTPCIAITGTSPTLSFAYHMFGGDVNSLHIDLIVDGILIKDFISPLTGQQQTLGSDNFETLQADLSSHIGQTIQVQFRAIRGSSYEGDIAIDDISIIDSSVPYFNFTVTEINSGCTTSYQFEQTGITPDSWAWDIDNDGIFDYTTQTPIHTYNTPNNYDVTLKITQGGEEFVLTKTDEVIYTTQLSESLPYNEDFETFISSTNATGFQNGWDATPNNNTDNYRWNVNTGGTLSSATGPVVDNTLKTTNGTYIYTEASDGFLGDETTLTSQCIELDANFPVLKFAYHMHGEDMGALHIDLILEDGTVVQDILPVIQGEKQPIQIDEYLYDSIYLTDYANQIVKIQFRADRGDSYEGDIAIDDINIYDAGQPFFDFTVTEVKQGCNTSFDIEGIGSGITNWAWDIDNNGTEDYTGQNINHIYLTANTYDIKLTVTINGNDYTLTKDDIVDINNIQSHSLPYIEDFENFEVNSNGTGMIDGWINNPTLTTLEYIWNVNNGETPSFSTGPETDNTLKTSLGKYLYTEASDGVSGDIATLTSPCILLDGNYPILKFAYHMYGGDMGDLHIDLIQEDGTEHLDLLVIQGEQQLSEAEAYLYDSVYLTAFSNETVQIRFRALSAGTFEGDIAIDDINIYDAGQPLVDFTIEENNASCNTSIMFTDITPGATAWSWDIDEDGIEDYNTASFTHTYDVVNTYDISLTVTINSETFNVTKLDLISSSSIQSLSIPYIEDFENFEVNSNGTGLMNGWTNSPTSSTFEYIWNVNNGETPSFSTGPETDNTLKTVFGKYLYTEASEGGTGDIATLTTPCILLDAQYPALKFAYHMYGIEMGDLHIDLIREDGTEVLDIMTILGAQHSSSLDPYSIDSISLLNFKNETVQIRFRAISNGWYEGDIAIDDINIYEAGQPFVNFIVEENNNTCIPAFTFTDITPGTTAWSWDVDEDGVEDYNTASFTHTYSSNGDFDVNLTVTLNGTNYSITKNDIAIVNSNNNVQTLPYNEDFETFTVSDDDSGYSNGWSTVANPLTEFRWIPNNGGTPSSSTGPDSDNTTGTLTGKYMFTEASWSDEGDVSVLHSPCIAISGNDAELTFAYHMYGFAMGELHIDVIKEDGSIDYDAGLPIIGEQQLTSSSTWENKIVDLSNYAGETITLQFRGIRGSDWESDMAIDDINITGNITPEVNFVNTNYTIDESTLTLEETCRRFVDLEVPLAISSAPSSDATLNITTSGSATDLIDYKLLTNSFTITAGNKDTLKVPVRIYSDNIVETTEALILGFNIVGTTNLTKGLSDTSVISIINKSVQPNNLPAIPNVAQGLNETSYEYLAPNSTVYFYNDAGEIIGNIENSTTWDYGCMDILIDRVGTDAVPFMTNNQINFLTEKTVLFTPENNNAAGSYTIELYYSNPEVLGWEAGSGNDDSQMNLMKSGGPIKNVSPATPAGNGLTNIAGITPTVTLYGTNSRAVKSNFTTGFSGFAAGVTESSVVLDITIESFELNNNSLHWSVSGLSEDDTVNLLASKNGVDFEIITTNSQSVSEYSNVENNTYYKIQVVSNEEVITSEIIFFNNTIDQLEVYPNPNSGQFTISYNQEGANVVISTISGLKVYEGQLNQGNTNLNLELTSGNYIISVTTNNGIINQLMTIQK